MPSKRAPTNRAMVSRGTNPASYTTSAKLILNACVKNLRAVALNAPLRKILGMPSNCVCKDCLRRIHSQLPLE